jgi:hypothetical protein
MAEATRLSGSTAGPERAYRVTCRPNKEVPDDDT